jgi:hypothetical protein
MRFRAIVELNGKTATGVEVPAGVLAGLGAGKRPKVLVTINGHRYRSSVGSMGGRSLLPLSADVRAATGVAAGDDIEIDLALDTAERSVTVPADLAAALAAVPGARAAFDALSYSNRHRHVLAVEGAKTEATRRRRIDRVVAELTVGA